MTHSEAYLFVVDSVQEQGSNLTPIVVNSIDLVVE